jgi:hypothetical protein
MENLRKVLDYVSDERSKALKSLESGKLNKGMVTINRKKFDMFDNILRLLCELNDYRSLGDFNKLLELTRMRAEEKSVGKGVLRKCPWCGQKMLVMDKRKTRFCKFCGKSVKH